MREEADMATERQGEWVLIKAATAPHGGAEGVPGVDRIRLTRKEIGSSRLSSGVTTFDPGAGLYWHMHHVEESVTVIEGEPVCEVGGAGRPVEAQSLQIFDTTFIPAYTPHRFYNPTTRLARIVWSYPAGHVERIRVNPDGTNPQTAASGSEPLPPGDEQHFSYNG